MKKLDKARNYPKRKVIRLQHYDYSQDGFYFITICIQNKLCLLGHVLNGKTILNPAGEMVKQCYFDLEIYFENLKCLDYVIMPNHIHFIVQIKNNKKSQYSLFDVIQYFKSKANVQYIKNVKQNNWRKFNKKLWQRSYYEHIICNERDYLNIAEYIENNPLNWELDKLYASEHF